MAIETINGNKGLKIRGATGGGYNGEPAIADRFISYAVAPSGENSMVYYNTVGNTFNGYKNGAWKTFLMTDDNIIGKVKVNPWEIPYGNRDTGLLESNWGFRCLDGKFMTIGGVSLGQTANNLNCIIQPDKEMLFDMPGVGGGQILHWKKTHFEIYDGKHIEFGVGSDLRLKSPNGQRWALRVDNAGTLTLTAV